MSLLEQSGEARVQPEPIWVADLKEEAPSDLQTSRGVVRALFNRADPVSYDRVHRATSQTQSKPFRVPSRVLSDLLSIPPLSSHIVFCVLLTAAAVEATLWRQVGQILFS